MRLAKLKGDDNIQNFHLVGGEVYCQKYCLKSRLNFRPASDNILPQMKILNTVIL